MTQAAAAKTSPRSSQQPSAWRRFRRNQLGVVGAIIVLTLLILAIFAPQLAPYDPSVQSLLQRRQPPSGEFWLGTDEFGRDIFSRLLFGTRFTLLISITSVSIGLVIGSVLGIIAGYVGGLTSGVIMRLMDLLLAFPYLLLAIIIVSALGPGVRNTIIAIGIWTVPAFARVSRGAVASIRERDFVQAAKALGNQRPRIIWRHILPNTLATLLVYASLYLAYAILMESALSFLGLGVQPPTPSWAVMISSGRNYITSAPHIATIPGIAIAVAVLGFNLLGDALRDALDPRTMPR